MTLVSARDEIKALLSDLQHADVSSTARLIAVLEAAGITDLREIETLTKSKVSTVREARRALKFQRQNSSGDGNPALENQRCDGNPAEAMEIQRQNSSGPRAHAQMESLRDESIQVGSNSPLTPQGGKNDDLLKLYDDFARVTMHDGRIILHNGLRQHWLDTFGGDETRLELALTQVANYIQPNSRRPLETQVSSQLARIAGDKRDRDQRYTGSKQTQPAMTNFDRKIEGARRFRELAHATARGQA